MSTIQFALNHQFKKKTISWKPRKNFNIKLNNTYFYLY